MAASRRADAEAVDQLIDSQSLRQLSDVNTLEALVREVVAANPGQVRQYRAGKAKMLGYFVGQVMKASRGKANPREVDALLRKALAEP